MGRLTLSLLPLVVATPLLLGGCGGGPSSERTDPGATPAPTSGPATSSAPVGTGPLAGFPLDVGYPQKNGDDASAVVVGPRPATTTFRLCGRTAWDPRTASEGVLGVKYRGESEDARGRTLVLYPRVDAARHAVTRTRRALAACGDDPHGKGQGTTHTQVDRSLGEQSVVWTDTFYNVSHGEKEHDTGLVVYEVVRVGRAVLLSYEYGEGNGTPASRAQSVAGSVRRERAVVDRMGRLSPGRSGSRA